MSWQCHGNVMAMAPIDGGQRLGIRDM